MNFGYELFPVVSINSGELVFTDNPTFDIQSVEENQRTKLSLCLNLR